jgi:hypothetical protein
VTELLDLALQTGRLGQFADAREQLRREIVLDWGPATLEAPLKLGRLLIESGQNSDRSEAD